MYSLRFKLTKCIEHRVYIRGRDIGLHAVRWTENQAGPSGRKHSRTINRRFANKLRIVLRHHGLRRDTAVEAQFLSIFAREPGVVHYLRRSEERRVGKEC